MLVSPDSKEGEVIGGVKVPHSAPGLGSQLLNLAGILNSRGIVQCATDWDTFMGETKVEHFNILNDYSTRMTGTNLVDSNGYGCTSI